MGGKYHMFLDTVFVNDNILVPVIAGLMLIFRATPARERQMFIYLLAHGLAKVEQRSP